MRRGWKIFWIVCASIAGIGLVLCVTGAGMGATLSGIGEVYAADHWFYWDDWQRWNGYDDNSKIESKEYSYHKNIWIDTMEAYFKDKETTWYNIPSNVVGVLVNPITGVIANDNDTKKEMFFYIKGTEPTLNGTTKDLDAVFKEENSLNEQKEAP